MHKAQFVCPVLYGITFEPFTSQEVYCFILCDRYPTVSSVFPTDCVHPEVQAITC